MNWEVFIINYRFSIIVPAYNVEKHINDTLNSLVNQSFKNFEVILVNDGSTDSTQDIIDKYCYKYSNFRSLYQKNQGVAAARNTGIEIAQGDYIGFLDADGDTFNVDALKNFEDTINNYNNPDLVIGRQTKIDPWGNHSYVNAKMLSNADSIEPHNKWLIWTMSLMNKVFSRKKLLKNGLKMNLLSYGSDGAFVLPFAYSCDNIAGCPHEIISYNKRIFSEGYSISQTSTIETLNDYLKVHDIIYTAFIEYSIKYRNKYSNDKNKLDKFENDYLVYLDALLHRKSSILLSQFYRFFWRTDNRVIEKTKELIDNYKTEMFPTSWEKLEIKNKDLSIGNLIVNKTIMVQKPHVTIAIDPNIKNDSLYRLLDNIHNFHFPSFEVFIIEDSYINLSNFFKEKEYMNFIAYSNDSQFKNEVINNSNGKFLWYIDKELFISLDLLKNMFDKLHNSKFDFLVSKIDSITNIESSINYDTNKFHNTFSNILLDISFLRKNDFLFTENVNEDIKTLFRIGDFTYYNQLPVFTIDYISNHHLDITNHFVSLIIDDMETPAFKINKMFESIYEQNFKFFNIILNGKLKSKVKKEFLEKQNLCIIDNFNKENISNNFKKLAIKESKAKYGIFINIPLIFESNSLKNLFIDIEEKNSYYLKSINNNSNTNQYVFSSSPFYCLDDKNSNKKLIKLFSSNLLAYTNKDLNFHSKKSKFMVFDLYLSNKLFNLDILRQNKIYFENPHEDVLNIYKKFKFSKINQKSLLTTLNQKNLFKSAFTNEKIPFSINILYHFHKIIFSLFILRRYLKNIAD